MLGETPPAVDDSSFDFGSLNYNNVILYVPQGALAAYQTAEGWRAFNNIVEFDATGIEATEEDVPAFEVTANGIRLVAAEGKAVAVYTAGGALIVNIANYAGEEIMLDKGVYVLCVGDKVVKAKL